MPEFRFLHAADIHLDSPLRGLAGQEGSTAERIRGAPREAFDRFIAFAIEERVDFVTIAGDLYDGDWKDYRTGLFFAAAMGRLNAAEIPVYLLHGNHDAQNEITRRLVLPRNVETFDAHGAETLAHASLPVVLHGRSFPEREVSENLVLAYPEPVAGVFNIGVLHTGLGGMGGHANYAPCTLADLVNKGYDYWALGHVHGAEVLHEHPHVVFPGNLQGRHIRETGPKGAMLVSVRDGVVTAVEPRHFDVVRWETVDVDVSAAGDMVTAVDGIGRALDDAVAERAEGRLLACRVRLVGRSPAHDQLLAGGQHLLAEARALALGFGEEAAWVEKVVVETALVQDMESVGEGIGELRMILDEAQEGAAEDLMEMLDADIGALVRSLPHEVRSEVEDQILGFAIEGEYAALARAVEPYLRSRLDAEMED